MSNICSQLPKISADVCESAITNEIDQLYKNYAKYYSGSFCYNFIRPGTELTDIKQSKSCAEFSKLNNNLI